MSIEKYSWQPWQLTAYVVGELEPEVVRQIETTAASDPKLAAEIDAIRSTIAQVTQLYQHETADIQPTQLKALQATAPDSLTSTMAHTNQDAQPVSVAQPMATSRSNRLAWIGLLAMSASLLIAVYMATPSATSWLLSRNDFKPLDEAKQSLPNQPVTKLEPSQTPAVQEPVPAANPVANSAGAEIAATGSLENLNEELGLFGDVQVEHVEELDLAIVRGSKADVERVKGVIDSVRVLESTKPTMGADVSDAQDVSGSGKNFLELPAALKSTVRARNEELARERASGEQKALSDGEAVRTLQTAASQLTSEATTLARQQAPSSGSENAGNQPFPVSNEADRRRAEFFDRMKASGSMAAGLPGGGQGGYGIAGNGMSVAETQSQIDAFGSETGKPQPDNDPRVELSLGKKRVEAESRIGRFALESTTTDRFEPIYENPFTQVGKEPLSTFSIDVDTASYVKARQFLLQSRRLPPANAVRIEEFVNYFEYEYTGPKNADEPFGAYLAVTDCPWQPEHKLVRIALQATKIDVQDRPKANIVFLLDVSGSMDEPNKLPLVKESMRMLVEQLGENDRVAMVVYAGAAGCVLESTTGDHQDLILGALDKLNAGGSTNGGQGIQLAYDLARDHFIPGGINRVILCTDGDFNVGVTSTDALVNLVAKNAKSKIFLTVLGYGMGNTNDAMMEQISNRGNGVYGFVDSRREAQRQMVKQLAGNLMTVAKDVKIQVEFNPARVSAYRLIGYENRVLAAEDFNNDKKDAGEIGAGHRVTALYEVEPVEAAGARQDRAPVDNLRYQQKAVAAQPLVITESAELSNELLVVKLRYKQPEGDSSKLLTFPLEDQSKEFANVDRDFKWAATVAEFAMLLRNSKHKGSATWSGLLEQADEAAGVSPDGTRQECLDMMRIAAGLAGH